VTQFSTRNQTLASSTARNNLSQSISCLFLHIPERLAGYSHILVQRHDTFVLLTYS
jgi:hypothetical protein